MAKRSPPNLQKVSSDKLTQLLKELEAYLETEDVLSISGPLFFGVDHRVRLAIEALGESRQKGLLIVLNTPGGVIEVAERVVNTIRHNYDSVKFLVPDRAMSAGTILAMSGDAILMDYFSCLGPIDPQVQKSDGVLVPALSYLEQFDRLKQRASEGVLTTVEVTLLQKLDLAELHRYELQRDLSIRLIQDWLVRYKFRTWTVTEGTGKPVTVEMKQTRAKEVAEILSDHKKWGSHGRGIQKSVLEEYLRLRVDDYGADEELSRRVRDYHDFLNDYMMAVNAPSFVHSREFL